MALRVRRSCMDSHSVAGGSADRKTGDDADPDRPNLARQSRPRAAASNALGGNFGYRNSGARRRGKESRVVTLRAGASSRSQIQQPFLLMLAVVLFLACLHVFGVIAMILTARNAPYGFEDENGFHVIATPPPYSHAVFLRQMPFDRISTSRPRPLMFTRSPATKATSRNCGCAQDRSLRSVHRLHNTFRAFISRRKIDGAR